MTLRVTAAFVFALFGAAAILGPYTYFEWSRPVVDYIAVGERQAVTGAWRAALSAGLMAACIGQHFRVAPVSLGIATMLLANIPFAMLTTLDYWMAGGRFGNDIEVNETIIFFLMVLVFGWIFAGILQIISGALAGLTMKVLLKHRLLSDNTSAAP